MELSEQLRQISKSRHMSIHALAVMEDIPYSTLYSIIQRNTQKVDRAIISKLASALNLDELFFTEDYQASDNSSPKPTPRLSVKRRRLYVQRMIKIFRAVFVSPAVRVWILSLKAVSIYWKDCFPDWFPGLRLK